MVGSQPMVDLATSGMVESTTIEIAMSQWARSTLDSRQFRVRQGALAVQPLTPDDNKAQQNVLITMKRLRFII